jgi:tripartite-type tricarboxylate transporter receptor subunit TctC
MNGYCIRTAAFGGLWWRAVTSIAFALMMQAAEAQTPEEFYRDKQVRLTIGYPAGSGYDIYARLLASHLGRNIPGRPTVIAENMPGAGSLSAMNHIYTRAARDGTVIGAVNRSVPLAPLLQTVGADSIHFDPLKFTWLGSMSKEFTIGFVWTASGIATFDDLRRRQVTTGTAAVTADGFVFPNMMNRMLGTKLKIILGYPGTNDVFLAVERGELDGYFGGTLSSLLTTYPGWIKDGKVKILVQIALEKAPQLPNVPLVTDFVKDDEQRQALKLVLAPQTMGRPYLAPPDVPKDRADALRAAFDQTMTDPAFVADAKKLGIEVSPIGGAQILGLLKELYATAPSVVAVARDALKLPERLNAQ